MASDQDLFGNFLPNIHIDRIVLESSSSELPPRKNPHIMSEDKLPEESPEKGMNVSVDFSIKYRIGNDPVSAWFKDANLKNYLKIALVQSTDAEKSKNISLVGQTSPLVTNSPPKEGIEVKNLSIDNIIGAPSESE